VGILNGCEYPAQELYSKTSKADLIHLMDRQLTQWASKSEVMLSAHWIAHKRIHRWAQRREKGIVVTSVGRITEQKVRLLKFPFLHNGEAKSVLQHVLDGLGDKGVFILLGSGDKNYEEFLLEMSGANSNFIFLKGYGEMLSQELYNSGDLFLMPSSFEPCGISQMLAMRSGQPCLVHGVGGLNDTVVDGVSGFVFRGVNGNEQAKNLLSRISEVIDMIASDQKKYKTISKAAAKARFSWKEVSTEYMAKLY
jgi:starch synthase